MKTSRVILGAGLALLAAACGPNVSLSTGISQQSTSLLLGAAKLPAPAAPVGLPVPSFPGAVTIPTAPVVTPPVVAIPPVVKVLACPPLDPLSFPDEEATDSVSGAVRPGVYTYRQSGSASVDGKKAVALPSAASVVVRSATPTLPTDTISFTVTTKSFGGAETATTYEDEPPAIDQSVTVPGLPIGSPGIPPTTITPPGGLFITHLTTSLGGTATSFTPAGQGIKVFNEPAQVDGAWTSQAIDSSSLVLLLTSGTDVSHERVDACGKQLDAWEVKSTTTILGLDEHLTEVQDLAIGTEYAGLPLALTTTITGTVNGHTISQKSTSTIDSIHPAPLPTTSTAATTATKKGSAA